MGVSRVTVSIPPDLYRAVEANRESRGMSRSAFVEEAIEFYVRHLREEDLERRLGISERLEDLADLVRAQADRLATLSMRDRYATERVYALVEAQFGDRAVLDREGAHRVAARRIERERGGYSS
jgi:thymidine phosphorylase